MGVIVPNFASSTEDRASGAQIVDGGLRFDKSKSQYLKRIPSSSGNTTTYTISCWVKRSHLAPDGSGNSDSNSNPIFAAGTNAGSDVDELQFYKDATNNNAIRFLAYPGAFRFDLSTTARYRDTSSWYHILANYDGTTAKIYVNGTQVTSFASSTQNGGSGNINTTDLHTIGASAGGTTAFMGGYISQFYFIDGQALGPGYFGYTDPLTNTWRPKKYTNTTSIVLPITAAPSLLNGALIIRATDASIAGTIVSGGGNLNFLDSSDGINWTHRSTGTSYTFSGAKYLAAGGSGTSNRTFTPSPSESYEYLVWNTNTNFDTGSNTTTDVTGSTFTASSSSIYGQNGFYLPFDGSAPIGQDQSGRGNDWTPVNFGGSNTIEKATGALPILNTDGGGKVARVGVRTDAYSDSLVLALPLVGIKSDFSNAVNSGTSNKTITANGNITGVTTTSNFYGGSFKFDGVGDYLSIPASSDFSFGTGDFTMEWWQSWYVKASYETIYENNYATSPNLTIQSGSGLRRWYVYYNGGSSMAETSDAPVGLWTHYALVRNGSSLKLYRNGVVSAEASGVSAISIGNGSVGVSIGHDPFNYDFTGFVQDFRIYKGIAKYTSNFIPASTDPDILPDTPSGVSYSSNLTQITDGAVAFDGSGDKLTSNSTDFVFGTSSFTVEAFVYKNGTSPKVLFSQTDNDAGGRNGIAIGYQSGALWLLQGNGSSWSVETTAGSFPTSRWVHIAVSRDYSATKTYYFIDGKLVYTYTSNINLSADNNGDIKIGSVQNSGTTYDWDGFISNLHIVKGTALYTSNFTPPSAPLTATENTKLLCCQSNTSAADFTTAPGDGISTQIYSAGITTGTALNASGSTGWVQAFDGSTSTLVYPGDSNGSTEITLQTPVSWSSTIRIYAGQNGTAGTNIIANGVNLSALHTWASGGDWQDVTSSLSSPLTSLKLINVGGQASNIRAVEIDGTVLTDAIVRNGNASATNFNPFTDDIDTQRGKQSGYATWNPLEPTVGTLSNGNLKMVGSSTTWKSTKGTVSVSSGKWYYEGIVNGATYGTSFGNIAFGIGWYTTKNLSPAVDAGTSSLYNNLLAFHNNGGYNNFATWQTSVTSLTAGDVIGIALNKDNNTFAFYKNGVSVVSGTLANTTDDLSPWINVYYSDSFFDCNFGQKPFKFPPPTGFQPLTLANTPRPTIVRPDQYVGTVTYTGSVATGSATPGVNEPPTRTGFLFKPDLLWIKDRNQSWSIGHRLYDSVRGLGVDKHLNSSSTNAEGVGNDETYGYITSFVDGGFTSANGTSGNDYVNSSATNYVVWAWKAGGNSNTFNIDDVGYDTASAAGLTGGTITPTGASVNTKSGFSIVKWDGSGSSGTLSHGLGKTPGLIFLKGTSAGEDGQNWRTYHSALGTSPSNTLFINLINTPSSNTERISAVGTDTFTLSSGGAGVNASGQSYIAYLWAEIPGFSKFGSYSGNGSGNVAVDGPVIQCGFRPAFILIKCTTQTQNWYLADSTRNPFNSTSVNTKALFPNSSATERDAEAAIDFLSNGFKLRHGEGAVNDSGATYIYAAFAEAPTFNLYGAQANAR